MGTQFWWFYDVLTVTIAAGLLYAAVAKGFNKLVFRLIGVVLSFVIGFFGSQYLASPVYRTIYQEKVTATFQTDCEVLELYESTAQFVQQNGASDAPENANSALIADTAQEICAGSEAPAWFTEAVTAAVSGAVDGRIAPKPSHSLHEVLSADTEALCRILTAYDEGNPAAMAACLEEVYIRPDYTEMVRMGLFLILEAVVLIIVAILSGMAGNHEELMHIRKLNRPLAVFEGLLETAWALFTVVLAVKLIVAGTDNMMLLFNEETIAKTQIFKYIYQII